MIRYKWSRPQYEFIYSNGSSVALLGGKGSGKTTALCRKGVILSYEYDNVGLLGRYKLSQSEDALLSILEQMLIGYEWHKRKETGGWNYYIVNKFNRLSQIKIRSLRDIGNISGMNLGWFGISEVDDTHLTEMHWIELCNRLRLGTVRRRHQALCEGTRSGNCDTGGWVNKVVKKKIYITTLDNKQNLPESFLQYIEGLSEINRARVVTGMYDVNAIGQIIYPEFCIRTHTDNTDDVLNRWQGSGAYDIWLGIDCPYQLACVVGIVYRGKIYIIQEIYEEDNLSINEFLDKIQGYLISIGIDNRYVINAYIDSAGGRKDMEENISALERFLERGWRVYYGAQRIKEREECVKKLLIDGKLIVDNKCSILISGFVSGYVRKLVNGVLSEKPLKNRYSHLQDALAYLCSGLLNDFGEDLAVNNKKSNYDYDRYFVDKYERIIKTG